MNEAAAARLTSDQIEALRLVHEYRTDKRIAIALSRLHPDRPITHHAVKERLRRARQVLGVGDRLEAANLLMGTPTFAPYPQGVYPPQSLPASDELLLKASCDEASSVKPPVTPELRDGADFAFDPLPELTARQWHDRLFRRPGERQNDLTPSETIRSIAVVTIFLALALFLVMKGMASWR